MTTNWTEEKCEAFDPSGCKAGLTEAQKERLAFHERHSHNVSSMRFQSVDMAEKVNSGAPEHPSTNAAQDGSVLTDHERANQTDDVAIRIPNAGIKNSSIPHILTINVGSSSLKFAIFQADNSHRQMLSGRIDRIGQKDARWIATETNSNHAEDRSVDAPDQNSAVRLLMSWLENSVEFSMIAAIGHRIVHGGSDHFQSERVTPKLIAELRKIISYDPEHLPDELDVIEAFQARDPNITQIACFDTAFHHDMPRVAQIVPIPRRFEAKGVRRYGFHGLSYAYLMEELARVDGADPAQGRIILAHLGAGASLAAVKRGHPIDTTMGFTPASGLVMGTRTGDLDPGLFRFLLLSEEMSAESFNHLVNHESGLLGVSESSADVRDLLARQNTDVRAAEAIELFCYQAKKGIGAFAAALGGLDTLVLSGGIGENSPEIRQRICDGLQFLGISLDKGRNESNKLQISIDTSPVKVLVIRTDEERMIAQAVKSVLDRAVI